jgi:hypothetical protein
MSRIVRNRVVTLRWIATSLWFVCCRKKSRSLADCSIRGRAAGQKARKRDGAVERAVREIRVRICRDTVLYVRESEREVL